MFPSNKRKRALSDSKPFLALFIFAGGISASSVYHPVSFIANNEHAIGMNRDGSAFVTLQRQSYVNHRQKHERIKLLSNSQNNNDHKLGATQQYLSNINTDSDRHPEEKLIINGDVNGKANNLNINGSKLNDDTKMSSTPSEDDDYAMSIPKSSRSVDDNESIELSEPSKSDGGEHSTRENTTDEINLIRPAKVENATIAILDRNASLESEDQQAFMSNLIRNFWAPKETNASEDNVDRAEESRRWSEWMTTGKKIRSTTSNNKISDDNTSVIAKERASPREALESAEATNLADEDTEKTVSPTKVLAKLKDELSRKKSEIEQQQLQRKLEQAEKQKILRKQMKREEKQYREQRDKDPGRISASDWNHNILNLPHSRILRDIRSPVVFSCIWATFWSAVYKSLVKASVSADTNISSLAGLIASSMTIPTTAHSVMVSAMSLLLVFRTNSAYQRFAEGRKIWEDIVSTSRDFSRMVKLYEFAIGTPKCRRIRLLIASFPYLLRHRIRPSLMQMKKVNDLSSVRDPENSLLLYPDISMKDTDPEIAALAYDEEETGASRRKTRELCWVDKRTLPWKLLPGTALDLCARAQNRPLWVVDRIAKELCVVEDMQPMFTNRERMTLLAYTDKLSKSIGACERIHQTVVPLNYARHALRSVTVWLWTLPFALIKDLGFLTGPIIAVIGWILFGVYEIGTRIEDPFQGTLRLSIYCDAIRRDVLADAIVRDTAFVLDGEAEEIGDTDGDEDAIFEFESDSDEYGESDRPSKRKNKAKNKLDKIWAFQNQE